MQALERFLASWKAHGSPVAATAKIPYGHFIVIQAIPGSTTGCSIDAMDKGIEGILAKMGLESLGPDRVFFRNSKGEVEHVDFRDVSAAIAAGRMKSDTIVFDASLGQSGDLSRWERRLMDTWMGRFVRQSA